MNSPIQKNFLTEGDVLSRFEWRKRLNIEDDVFSSFIDLSIFKLNGSVNGIKNYRLDYVGLIECGDNTYFSIPKLYRNLNIALYKNVVTDIFLCIQRYQTRFSKKLTKKLPSTGEVLLNDAGYIINLFSRIVSWTQNHGIHKNNFVTLTDSFANIDWQSTIDRSLAIHQKTGTFYSQFFGTDIESEVSDLGIVQAKCLVELMTKLHIISDVWLSEFDPILESCQELLINCDKQKISNAHLHTVVSEAEIQLTRDHDRELAIILSEWLKEKSSNIKHPLFFGINAFHVVWEDMCRATINEGQNVISHREIASQPKYIMGSDDLMSAAQIPDIIIKSGDSFIIADAKWYRFVDGELPGLHDVVKQFMYQMSALNKSVSANIFLIPHLRTDTFAYNYLGKCEMNFNGDLDDRFPEISIIGVGWNEILYAYKKGEHLPSILNFATTENKQ